MTKKILSLLIFTIILSSCDPVLTYYSALSKIEYKYFLKHKTISRVQNFVKRYPTSPIIGYVDMDLEWMIREHNKRYLANKTKTKRIVVYTEFNEVGQRNKIAEDLIYRGFIDQIRPFLRRSNLEIVRIENLPFALSKGDMFIYMDFVKKRKTTDSKFYFYFPKLTFNAKPYYKAVRSFTNSNNYSDYVNALTKKDLWFKIKTMLYVLSGRFEVVLPDVLLDFSDFDFTRFVAETGNPWLIDAIIKTGDEDLISNTLFRYVDIIAVRDALFYYAYRWDGLKLLLKKPYLFLSFTDNQKEKILPLLLNAIVNAKKPVLFTPVLYYMDALGISDSEKAKLKKIYLKYQKSKQRDIQLQNKIIYKLIHNKSVLNLK